MSNLIAQNRKLETTLDKLYSELHDLTGDDDKFSKTVDQIVKLEKLQADIGPKPISNDVLVTAIANIVGIAMILKFEQAAVVTSKAITFAGKLR